MIRAAEPSDFPVLVALAEELRAPGFNWPPEHMQSELSVARTRVFCEDQMKGFLCFRESGDIYEITVLATSPRFRRQGIQGQLIRSLQALAAQQHKAVLLEVHAGNEPAKALYAKAGFQVLHERKNYYSDSASALVLRWSP